PSVDGELTGYIKRKYGGIYGVIRAVDQLRRNVDHREAEGAVLERVDDACLHRRNVIARHHAALDLLAEAEARAARQRFDVEHDVAVLAVTARLLLVAAALHDALLDGLAVADRGFVRHGGDAGAIGQPLGGHAQLHLTLPPYHHFMRLGVVDDADGRVLLEQFRERLPQLDVVLAFLGGDRDGQHRRMGRDLGERRMRLLAVAQGVAGFGMIELSERDGIAGSGPPPLPALPPNELEHTRPPPPPAVGVQESGAVSNFSAEHAGHRHLAAVRGIDGLEHVSNWMAPLHAEPFCGLRDAGGLVA